MLISFYYLKLLQIPCIGKVCNKSDFKPVTTICSIHLFDIESHSTYKILKKFPSLDPLNQIILIHYEGA